ncbi:MULTISPECIES: ankyrin repeat domain-containing protein [Nocardia]|uniref:ankyrin repeat domain-containing protein n=1 Tax=Nocardia TaxID=1817 RepID=UPI000D688C44|nr:MULTISPECIES: ankyrin repeat domain-containing protein [Nocardia]
MWKKKDKQPAIARDEGGRTPLHYAAADSSGTTHDQVAELIAGGQDPNDRDNAGVTPLHGAAQYDGVQTVRVLLDAGAEVNARDDEGNTPLMYAVRSPWTSPEVIALLRDRGGDPTIENRQGSSPLSRIASVSNKPHIRAVFADLLDDSDTAP